MQDIEQPIEDTRIISTRTDIVTLLRGLSGNRSTAVFSFINSNALLSGRIARINAYFDEVIFSEEPGSDAKFPAGKASLITVLSSVKAQFHAERVEPTEFEGKPAWRVRIPKMVYFSERRDCLRIATPTEMPLDVHYPNPKNGESAKIALRIVDIGEGGIAIMVNPLQVEAGLGKELKNCVVSLPNIGELTFDLIVQNTTEISDASATSGRRCGCQFSNISLDGLEMIRKYVERNKT
jgi:flagellar brake protein